MLNLRKGYIISQFKPHKTVHTLSLSQNVTKLLLECNIVNFSILDLRKERRNGSIPVTYPIVH